jgi:hypothetical protein
MSGAALVTARSSDDLPVAGVQLWLCLWWHKHVC